MNSLHKIDLDKIIDKDDPANNNKFKDNPWRDTVDISNIKQVIKTIKDINYYKFVGSIIFILPAIIFIVLNLYCLIEKKIDTKPCGNANEEDDDDDDAPCNQSDGECQENTESFVESRILVQLLQPSSNTKPRTKPNSQTNSNSNPNLNPEPKPKRKETEDKDESKSTNNKPNGLKPFIFSFIAIICNIFL